MRELTELLEGLDAVVTGRKERIITGLAYDSRAARTGNIFVAIKGEITDGHEFIDRAIENGAMVIVHDRDLKRYREEITYVRVKNSREAMPHLAARFYYFPANEMLAIGVTGTNGKTTITYYIQHLLAAAHQQAAIVGTTGVHYAGQFQELPHTTPESVDLQAILADLVIHNCRAAVLEVSSHALIQHRADNISFNAAIFTNLTQDHLDYHQTMDAYASAKQNLFNALDSDALAVINSDDEYANVMIEKTAARVIRYGQSGSSDYRLAHFVPGSESTEMTIQAPQGELKFTTNIVGLYNGYNLLAAMATVMALGYDFAKFRSALTKMPAVPGRLQQVGTGKKKVFIDYAHTPSAMETVLTALRHAYPESRLITVFGCGGDRDKGKRPIMGKIATELSDYTVITDDNPRSESTEAIIRDILTGCKPKTDFEVIPHRYGAIQRALRMASETDVIAVLGKGHENYQEKHGIRYHFDDSEVITRCLEANGC
ncbi:MAG: UDP-N-acetylmuramoyl-L-alanyl-D-glutamate--2,6-diaminopimelate ligase [Lentisphaeria bacterium]|nr:UDP-N-acetylmuramoyl-L-alanyl-D-glutamate--2,6-diaminopimelate ligase [Candidatus Neomarinimicrobiota bacterium]MCF7842881.1 UDP-N-acetylmuramoyl-L-alanyl-D-glutamate--2,6-diaminopimelate ligase [Lentisphaeria bacterium]